MWFPSWSSNCKSVFIPLFMKVYKFTHCKNFWGLPLNLINATYLEPLFVYIVIYIVSELPVYKNSASFGKCYSLLIDCYKEPFDVTYKWAHKGEKCRDVHSNKKLRSINIIVVSKFGRTKNIFGKNKKRRNKLCVQLKIYASWIIKFTFLSNSPHPNIPFKFFGTGPFIHLFRSERSFNWSIFFVFQFVFPHNFF